MSEKLEAADRRDELDPLIGRACDDTLDGADRARLTEALRERVEHREAYLDAMSLEGLLAAEHDTNPLADLLSSDPLVARGAGDRAVADRRRTLWPADTRPLVGLAALAATLLLAVGVLRAWEQSHDLRAIVVSQQPTAMDGMPVGRIARTDDARWGTPLVETAPIVGGQRLRLLEGIAQVQLDRGVTVTLEGPSELEIVSGMQVRATQGTIRATAGASAEGFVIETPTAQLVQVGRELNPKAEADESGVGLAVRPDGATDVVVYDGIIDLQFAKQPAVRRVGHPHSGVSYRVSRAVRTIGSGEALRVVRSGGLRPIDEVDDRLVSLIPPTRPERVIVDVRDGLRDPESDWRHEVVAGGFGEDCRAFVDRLHQWNGVDGRGLPAELIGADYVQTFAADKWSTDLSLTIDLAAPAELYVLADDRAPTPRWLRERFVDTGVDLGLDEGWSAHDGSRFGLTRTGKLAPRLMIEPVLASPDETGSGPGVSVDAVYSVWRRDVDHAGPVTLGPPGAANERSGMYGVVAVPRS